MADAKASALTALAAPAGVDLMYIIDDPAGTPVSKKVTVANLLGAIANDVTLGWVDFVVARIGVNSASFGTNGAKVGIGNAAPVSSLELTGPAASPLNTFIATTNVWSLGVAGTGVRVGLGATSGITYGSIDVLINGGASADGVLAICALGGGVVVGDSAMNANAILDLVSTTKAFMPPRMTEAQRDAIASPTAGMVVYNIDDGKLNIYTTTWEVITSA